MHYISPLHYSNRYSLSVQSIHPDTTVPVTGCPCLIFLLTPLSPLKLVCALSSSSHCNHSYCLPGFTYRLSLPFLSPHTRVTVTDCMCLMFLPHHSQTYSLLLPYLPPPPHNSQSNIVTGCRCVIFFPTPYSKLQAVCALSSSPHQSNDHRLSAPYLSPHTTVIVTANLCFLPTPKSRSQTVFALSSSPQ